MTVKVRQRTRNGATRWEVDIHVRLPTGRIHRERRNAPSNTERGARRWAQAREAELIRSGLIPRKEKFSKGSPKLAEFTEVFLERQRAIGRKPSTIANQRSNLRNHLIPMLGKIRLAELEQRHVSEIQTLTTVGIGTRNKLIACLSAVLKTAQDLGAIKTIPVRLKALPSPKRRAPFYPREDFERLLAAACELDLETAAAVLLGGEAGLRAGEIRALEWTAVALSRGILSVEASEWKGQVTAPKSNRYRVLPMSTRLRAVLTRLHRARRSAHVLARDDGSMVTDKWLRYRLWRAQDRAGLPRTGMHILRHTFCSHLAEAGVRPAEIKELAGHSSIQHTDRYMHLSPGALEGAIAKLDAARGAELERTSTADEDPNDLE